MTQPTNSIDSIRIPVKCTHCGAIDYLELPKPTKAQLLAEILKCLPKKKKITYNGSDGKVIQDIGYNEAIDETTQYIEQLFNVKEK